MSQREQRYCAYQRKQVTFSNNGGKFSEVVCERSFPVETNQHICDARCIHSVSSAAVREFYKTKPVWMIEEAFRMTGTQDYTSEEYLLRDLVCDICGVGISGRQMHIFKYSEILNATNQGYVPDALTNPQVKMEHMEGAKLVRENFSVDRDHAAMFWKANINTHVGEDYGLCNTCQIDIRRYIPQGKEGAKKGEISTTTKRWWQFWKKGRIHHASNGRPQSNMESKHDSIPRSYADKKKKCVNCGSEIPSGRLQCSSCGSDLYIWE